MPVDRLSHDSQPDKPGWTRRAFAGFAAATLLAGCGGETEPSLRAENPVPPGAITYDGSTNEFVNACERMVNGGVELEDRPNTGALVSCVVPGHGGQEATTVSYVSEDDGPNYRDKAGRGAIGVICELGGGVAGSAEQVVELSEGAYLKDVGYCLLPQEQGLR